MDLRIFVEPQNGASYDEQLAMARAAEDGGFSAFFRSDHLLAIVGDGHPGPTDSWVTLGALARETSRIRLGTLVSSATFRLPGPLAVAVAQVDAMSGGRIELGLGTGWYEQEHTAYGVPFPPLAERFERLAEQLEIVTGLWRAPEGSTFSYDGRHYRLADSPALPKPVQRPHPPLVVGGFGTRRTPALAARFAAEFNTPFASPADAARSYDAVRDACRQAGRDPATMTLSAAVTVCVGADDAQARRRADAAGVDPDRPGGGTIVGTPDQVVDRLGAYAEAGATRAYLQLLDIRDLDQVALLAAEVAAQLR